MVLQLHHWLYTKDQKIYEIEWQEVAEAAVEEEATEEKWLVLHQEASKSPLFADLGGSFLVLDPELKGFVTMGTPLYERMSQGEEYVWFLCEACWNKVCCQDVAMVWVRQHWGPPKSNVVGQIDDCFLDPQMCKRNCGKQLLKGCPPLLYSNPKKEKQWAALYPQFCYNLKEFSCSIFSWIAMAASGKWPSYEAFWMVCASTWAATTATLASAM